MKIWKIIRPRLMEVQIFSPEGRLKCTIHWPKNKLWRTQNAPLSDLLGDALQANPVFVFEGKKWIAGRSLQSDRALVNDFDYVLVDESGATGYTATHRKGKWMMPVQTNAGRFEFKRHGLFRYKFTIEMGGKVLAEFADVTPFWTFSSRREFIAKADESLDPMLICFCFFISHNWFFA